MDRVYLVIEEDEYGITETIYVYRSLDRAEKIVHELNLSYSNYRYYVEEHLFND